MIEIALWVAVGAFIGWSVPQPAFAVRVQTWLTGVWAKITG